MPNSASIASRLDGAILRALSLVNSLEIRETSAVIGPFVVDPTLWTTIDDGAEFDGEGGGMRRRRKRRRKDGEDERRGGGRWEVTRKRMIRRMSRGEVTRKSFHQIGPN